MRKSLSLCASASLRAVPLHDPTAYRTRSTQTPDATPASISVSAEASAAQVQIVQPFGARLRKARNRGGDYRTASPRHLDTGARRRDPGARRAQAVARTFPPTIVADSVTRIRRQEDRAWPTQRICCRPRSSAAIRSPTGWSIAPRWRSTACRAPTRRTSGAFPAEWLEQAQDDGTILAIRDMERAGIDIITDGEIRRESYSNRFALALEGIDAEQPGRGAFAGRPRHAGAARGRQDPPPRRRWSCAMSSSCCGRPIVPTKITLPGPFTLSQQAKNEFYADEEEMAMDYAVAVNAELRDLKASGVDVVQLDEPWVRTAPDKAERYGVRAINRALEGIEGPTVVHLCFGYAHVVQNKPSGYAFLPQLADTIAQQISIEAAQPKLDLGVLADLSGKQIMLGVLDLGSAEVETAEQVAARIRAGLRHVAAERLIPAPDCGMKYLPRERAFGKLRALVDGAAIVRHELAG